MTEIEERALSRALHQLVEDPVVPAGLAERVRQRHRRRRVAVAGTVAAMVVFALAGGVVLTIVRPAPTKTVGRQPTSQFPSREPADYTIHNGRFVATVRFDGGALTITSPPAGDPGIDEAAAIRAFRSTGLPQQLVAHVVVGYGVATIRSDVPGGWAAAFVDRPAWVIRYDAPPRAYSCPMMTSAPHRPSAPPVTVVLLDAASGTQAVLYSSGESICGSEPTGPNATLVREYVSVPWTEVSRVGTTLTIQFPRERCQGEEMTTVTDSGQGQELAVYAARPLMTLPCPAPQTVTRTVPVAGDRPVTHAPTGPLTSLFTSLDPDRFEYDDGTR